MIKVGVGIFVYNDKNQVLIGKRLNSIGHGTLALPGGHLEHHESFENCSARELDEETCLNFPPQNFKFGTAVTCSVESQQYVTIFMSLNQPIKNDVKAIVAEPEKCESWSWVDFEDLKAKPKSALFEPLNVLFETRQGFKPWN